MTSHTVFSFAFNKSRSLKTGNSNGLSSDVKQTITPKAKCGKVLVFIYLFKSQEQKMEKNSVSFSVDEKVLDQNMFRIYVFSVHFLYNNKIINKNILSKYVSDHSDSCEYNHTISRCLSLIQ